MTIDRRVCTVAGSSSGSTRRNRCSFSALEEPPRSFSHPLLSLGTAWRRSLPMASCLDKARAILTLPLLDIGSRFTKIVGRFISVVK
jgi:hypothetical protein